MSETQEVDVEEVKSDDEYKDMKAQIQDLEDRIMDLEDRLEAVERNGREAEMHDQFNQESNYGY